jgi:hypothetical protein
MQKIMSLLKNKNSQRQREGSESNDSLIIDLESSRSQLILKLILNLLNSKVFFNEIDELSKKWNILRILCLLFSRRSIAQKVVELGVRLIM